MPGCLFQRIGTAADIQKRQPAGVFKAQRDIQILETYITVNAKDPLSLKSQGPGKAGTDRGFSGSALTGQNGDQFTHVMALLFIVRIIIKEFRTKINTKSRFFKR